MSPRRREIERRPEIKLLAPVRHLWLPGLDKLIPIRPVHGAPFRRVRPRIRSGFRRGGKINVREAMRMLLRSFAGGLCVSGRVCAAGGGARVFGGIPLVVLGRRLAEDVAESNDVIGRFRYGLVVRQGIRLSGLPRFQGERGGGLEHGRLLPFGDEGHAVLEAFADGLPASARQLASGAMPQFADEVDEGRELEVGVDEPGELIGGLVAVRDVVVFDHVEAEPAEQVLFFRGHTGAFVRVESWVVRDEPHAVDGRSGKHLGEEMKRDLRVAVSEILLLQTSFQLIDRLVFLGERGWDFVWFGPRAVEEEESGVGVFEEIDDFVASKAEGHVGGAEMIRRQLAHLGVQVAVVDV